MCVAHRLQAFLQGKQQASRLWTSSSPQMLKAVRQIMTTQGVEHPEEFTLKMFRAGHATSLAAEGKSVGAIIQAGEWRSAALLAYIDEDAVDAGHILEAVLDDSGED